MDFDTRPDRPRHRIASQASLVPLLVMVAGAFLPTARSCSRMEVPVETFGAEPGMFAMFGPPYVVAALFAVITIVAMVRGFAPRRRGRMVAAIATGLCGLVSFGIIAAGVSRLPVNGGGLALLTLLGGGVTVVGWIAFAAGIRSEGWRSWARLLAAFASFALASPLGVILVGSIFDDVRTRHSEPSAGPGAAAFLIAVVALGTVAGWGAANVDDEPTAPRARAAGDSPDEVGERSAFR
jgi:hypothetical protein